MEFIDFCFTHHELATKSKEEISSIINKAISPNYECTNDFKMSENPLSVSVIVRVGIKRKMDKNQYLLF